MTMRVPRTIALPAILLGSLLAAGSLKAEDGLRLRAIDPKPFYRPGDRIVLEMRCLGAVTEEAMVLYNPAQAPDEGFLLPEFPKCPVSRFEVSIPKDFVGANQVTVTTRHGTRLYADVFHFEVRSEAPLADLMISTVFPDAGCDLLLFDGPPAPQGIYLFSVGRDGTRFDLCREGKVSVTAEPPENASFAMKGGSCSITPKKPGPFRIAASYRGLRKEWTCTVSTLPAEHAGPRPSAPVALPARKIAPDELLKDPRRFERHPVQVGRCRTVEHWNTGFCYVFAEGRGKVSPPVDVRCTDVAALRERMERAIRAGLCDARPPEAAAAFVTPRDPNTRAGDLVTPRADAVASAGAAGALSRISIPSFRIDPSRLDRHPMDVGRCRLVEHHATGNCYVYSLPESQKVSEAIDARCADLPEQRRRMKIAIDEGRCGVPAAGAAGGAGGTAAASQPGNDAARARTTMSGMRSIAMMVESYGADQDERTARYPRVSDIRALAQLCEPKYMPAGATPLADAWGTPLLYVSDGKSYRIVSAGADRAFEADSSALASTPAGETRDPAKDIIFSDGRFLQWPR